MIVQEIFDAAERFGDFVDGCRIGAADMAFAAFSKGVAGNKGDVFGF